MGTIDSINDQYTKRTKSIDILRAYFEKLSREQINIKLSAIEKATRSMRYLESLAKETDCREYTSFDDTISIGSQYFSCFAAINDYKAALLKVDKDSTDIIWKKIRKVEETQGKYNLLKEAFQEKYDYCVDSLDVLNRILSQCIESAIAIEENAIERLKDEAREIANHEYTTVLKMSDPIQITDMLPDTMLVARYPVQSVAKNILRDIGIRDTYQNVNMDLRSQGNIIINADFEHMADDKLDEFVITYILRFIETLPLGAVQVHIFDQNTNYLYKRLNNSFQSESAGDTVKKIVQLHSSLSDLSSFSDVICEDIFRKTSVDKPDLYSIYESDKSDSFNLIIIRDGLVDGGGYASADILDRINSLTKPGDIGHKCGLRFLIVDNSGSFTKNLVANSMYLINAIQDNCEFKISYADGEFRSADKKIEVLHIQENLELFIQERSKAIVEALSKKEKNYVLLEDVSAEKIDENVGNIMYIPVGMSGGKIVELPLSCKDEDGTVAGQCIGYMAIGQSGSGKSSFFHSVVLNGCMKYSPQDLQFWLLDFKNGGASSKYSKCGIPHIKIIAENNKIDDALCLFQMVLEEMERRSKAFNKNFTDNIVEYNKKAKIEGLEYFPRIVVAIDEVQEIFREDNASVIQKLISSISTRMRSAGMHFIMIAQNLSEGKSYMLKDAFLPSATGRICFRVAQDLPRDSGFEDDFIERRQEIAELKTGEAYVSYGKDTIKKVKMAFISPQDMSEKYFDSICSRYPDCSNMRPLVIGSKKRLTVIDSRQGMDKTYCDSIDELKPINGIYSALIGEDVYRMSPVKIQFSQHENSAVLFLGSDKRIASSLCASTVVSLMRQNVKIHLFNGDRTKIQEEYETLMHPFMYLCQNIALTGSLVENHRLDQLKDVLRDLYSEYLERQALVQKADYEELLFPPMFLVVNDLFGIESFINDDIVENAQSKLQPEPLENLGFNFNYEEVSNTEKKSDQFREGIQKILGTLLKNGYRHNLHVVLAIKGDPLTWRNLRAIAEINNVVLFNDTEYADQIGNTYYLKEMLKNISNGGEEETMAVWSSRKSFSKIRPIIYKMSKQTEKAALDKLVQGG